MILSLKASAPSVKKFEVELMRTRPLPASTRKTNTHVSRTTSGSIRFLSSSPFKSLQHTPSLLMLCLSHFTGKGASVSDVGAAATAQMGG